MSTVTFEALRASRHDTRDSLGVMHPDNPFLVVHLPRSEVLYCEPIKGANRHSVEIPEWLAKEKNIG